MDNFPVCNTISESSSSAILSPVRPALQIYVAAYSPIKCPKNNDETYAWFDRATGAHPNFGFPQKVQDQVFIKVVDEIEKSGSAGASKLIGEAIIDEVKKL